MRKLVSALVFVFAAFAATWAVAAEKCRNPVPEWAWCSEAGCLLFFEVPRPVLPRCAEMDGRLADFCRQVTAQPQLQCVETVAKDEEQQSELLRRLLRLKQGALPISEPAIPWCPRPKGPEPPALVS